MADEQAIQAGSDQTATGERRTHERVTTRGVRSLLGRVVDLSPGGMCVEHEGRRTFQPNDAFDVIVWREACELLVTVRVVWSEPMGAGGCRLGLEFVSGGPQLPKVVAELARKGCGQLVGPECWLAA